MTVKTRRAKTKNVMVFVPSYLLIDTAFALVQWIMVAPLTALAWSGWRRRTEVGQLAGEAPILPGGPRFVPPLFVGQRPTHAVPT
jgi:hypothetical protein